MGARAGGALRRSLLPLVLTLLLAACTGGGSVRRFAPTATAAAVGGGSQEDAYLTHLAATGAFRGSVLVARGGAVLLSKGYGPADEDAAIANTPRTRFRIGSITKQFTAMAILILQERGKLSVQDRLCRYLTTCPQAWAPITLEQLLTHTSGIPDYTNFADFPDVIGTPVSVADLIARFADKPLDFPPGAHWGYSNSGYILLGAIVERVSGEPYAAFLQDSIFGPLGLKDSGYDINNPTLPEHATGYLSAHVKPVYLDMSEFYAAGALYSTVADLYTWDRALAAHRLISRQSTDAMFAVHIPCPANGCALASDLGYGYGWFVAKDAGRTLIYHLGHIDGFLTFNGFYPDDDVDVVVLSNMDSSAVLSISTHLGALALDVPAAAA
jgi:CubicO group peptidase (beta-lactamase class C family)